MRRLREGVRRKEVEGRKRWGDGTENRKHF